MAFESVPVYPAQYSVGDAVTVLYYAGAGDDAHLDDWFNLWGAPLVLLAACATALPIGIGILLWLRFDKQPQPETGG